MSSSNNLENKNATFLNKSNSGFIEEMYVKFIEGDPNLPESWRSYFESLNEDLEVITKEIQGPNWSPKKIKINRNNLNYKNNVPTENNNADKKVSDSIRAITLIRAYRTRGHLIANLDPLGLMKREYLHDLHPKDHGFTADDLNRKIFLDNYMDIGHATIKEITNNLKKIYCSTIGAEFMHITDPAEKVWFRERMEKKENQLNFTRNGKIAIMNKIIQAEGFEKFLAKKYVGTKRFGLDGGESLIPSLEQIIKRGGQLGAKEIKIGMPHRGRLNVLANVLQKSYKRIFNEFAGEFSATHDDSTGDVKYHLGASSDREFDGNSVHVSLTDNPSHLEAVNPIVLGQTRAKQFFHKDEERKKVIPVLIHGDAAFAGQGVVAECFAMSGLKGHNTGGTIHIIVNNQIGFTTSPRFARSSPYPSDLGKVVESPILHCNGDDPESVVHCAKIAIEFRQKFNKDVVIDMICYRRFGHNEGDEPSFTQPLMYKKIRAHPTTLNIYGKKLVQEGTLSESEFNKMNTDFKQLLENQFKTAKDYKPKLNWFEGTWSRYQPTKGKDKKGVTGVNNDKIKKISEKINSIPSKIFAHKTIERVFSQRAKTVAEGKNIDWSTAESLAFGTLLEEGFPVRLVGQDSGRGTFSQRHSVIRNQNDNSRYIPLNNISNNQKKYEIVDSLLSELAVLGFEYGYSLVEPETLTIWEAQFGDFANGALVVIDQFIASGEHKWARLSGLIMMLPHGFEGQGPEHSSARLERFLQLCAENNMQICIPTTPSQIFHLLRRQAIRPMRRPLIIMSPKWILRHKLATSSLEELAEGGFESVIDDPIKNKKKVVKIILCSGKVYYHLLEARDEKKIKNIAIIRIEQLYPFPDIEMDNILKKYSHVESIIWCQEEPRNQGAWYNSQHFLRAAVGRLSEDLSLDYCGRASSAAPSSGFMSVHLEEQRRFINAALET